MKLKGCFPMPGGISITIFISPILQHGQRVILMPVSFNIISLRE